MVFEELIGDYSVFDCVSETLIDNEAACGSGTVFGRDDSI